MELTEPVALPDVFAEGLARVEVLGGGFARLVFFSERRIAQKIVIPIGAAPDIALALTKATAIEALGMAETVYN